MADPLTDSGTIDLPPSLEPLTPAGPDLALDVHGAPTVNMTAVAPAGRPDEAIARAPSEPAAGPATIVDIPARWESPVEGAPTSGAAAAHALPADEVPTPVRHFELRDDVETPVELDVVAAAAAVEPDQPSALATEASEDAPPLTPRSPGLPPRPEQWASERKTARPWPRGAKIAIGAAGAMALLVILGGRLRSEHQMAPPAALPAQEVLVEDGRSLRDRTERTAEDFGTPGSLPLIRTQPPAPSAGAGATDIDDDELARRRQRRRDNPEDLKSRRKRSRSERRSASSRRAPRAAPAAPPAASVLSEPRTITIKTVDAEFPEPGAARAPRRNANGLLVQAGARVRGQLASQLVIRNRRATAIIRLYKTRDGLPKGTKLIGTATATRDGHVDIAARTLVLPDGQELRVKAEVQAHDGSAGLLGSVSGGRADDGSVAGDVADSSGRRAVRTALGGGLVGGVVDDVTSSERRRRRSSRRRPPVVVSVPKNTRVYVLFETSVKTMYEE